MAAEIVGGANPGEKRDMGREVALGRRQGNLEGQRAFVWVFWGGRIPESFDGEILSIASFLRELPGELFGGEFSVAL